MKANETITYKGIRFSKRSSFGKYRYFWNSEDLPLPTGELERKLYYHLGMEPLGPGSGGMGFLIGCKDTVAEMKRDIDTYLALCEIVTE